MDSQSEQLLANVIRNTRVAALGTLRDQAPLIEMVQFVTPEDFSAFYIHVSRLAQYTVDMQKDKHIGLLIAESDDGRRDPQTLIRLSIRGSAEMMQNGEPGSPSRVCIYRAFRNQSRYSTWRIFNLWRIKPKGGRLIAGFGKAYNITPETLIQVAHL